MRVNLLKETIECLHEHGKQESDVIWVGRDYFDYRKQERICYKNNWDNFRINADFWYDDGYGGNEIGLDLKVVGKDFWLERQEYDGAEWWEFKALPTAPEETRDLYLKEN